jgi:endogenous inhibitor of DNA gyrase (YacG/DUF329 family)
MSVEVQKRKCKVCSKESIRANVGTYTKKSSKRWIGEDGRQWNGRKCPQCQADTAKVNMRRLRAQKREPNESGT